VLVLLDKPGAARVLPDVAPIRAKFVKQLAAVRDPEAYKTWDKRALTNRNICRRWR
jgi:hypothetical protein